MDPICLKVVGIGLNTLGALILAIRVKRILDALAAVAVVHEANIQELQPANRSPVQLNFVNSTNQVKKAQKLGTKLLAFGFALMIVGNVLNGIGILLSR